MMKAIVKARPEKGLWLQEVDVPEPGPNDVRIKIVKNAICGTDMHIYKWDAWAQKTVPYPMVIGHEFTGVIESVGESVTDYTIGQRVSAEGHLTCGKCRSCRSGMRYLCPNTKGLGYHCTGAFAEYLVIPQDNVFPLPDDIDDDIGAILDPLGNAVHTALEADLAGQDVLITGAGPVGLLATAVARKVGARSVVVTDVNEKRLELSRQMGATAAFNVASHSIDSFLDVVDVPEGFTVGMEMSGNPSALETLIRYCSPGAHISLLGILPPATAIDWDSVIFKGLTLKGIYGRRIFKTWYQMQGLLQAGMDVRPVITHRFPIEDFEYGFQVMQSGEAAKVILEW